MKFLIIFAAVLAIAYAAPVDLMLADETRICDIVVPAACEDLDEIQSVVVQHYGDDYQAGDMLYDQINELVAADGPCRREIILKCKHAGCKFFLSATTDLSPAPPGGLKIRGLLKDGRRPIIWNTGPINIGAAAAASLIEFEKVNLQADGFSSSQSNVVIDAAGALVKFDEVDFIGHSAGYGNGGALLVKAGQVLITSSKFINNAAKLGGAIHFEAAAECSKILDSAFVDNAAIEQGGAIHNLGAAGLIGMGNHFKGNTANKKGDNFIGEGGAIYTETAIEFYETRTHGGNSAQFGNFLFATAEAAVEIIFKGFGCYEGPFTHDNYGTRGDYDSYDAYHAYPVCSADSYDSYAPREDFYLENAIELLVSRIDLPGGVICGEDAAIPSTIERSQCGSYVQSYHCAFATDDKPVEAEDYDRDGFDCRYDCNDLWNTVNPAAAEQCNNTLDAAETLAMIRVPLTSPRGYGVFWLVGDSNCNGLVDEFVDTDGDWVPDDVDRCPLDYWKVDPGHCGCGIEESDYCGSSASECGTTEYGGVWYYMCEGDWWYWGESDWVYGGTY